MFPSTSLGCTGTFRIDLFTDKATPTSATKLCTYCSNPDPDECFVNRSYIGSNITAIQCSTGDDACFTATTLRSDTSQDVQIGRGCGNKLTNVSSCLSVHVPLGDGVTVSSCTCLCANSTCPAVRNFS